MKKDLVRSLLDTALQRVRNDGVERALPGTLPILSVHLVLGELLEVNPEAFRTEWDDLARGTYAENATLSIRRLPAEFQCMVCFQKYQPSNTAPLCPHCGSVGARVLSGEECFVESIQVEHE